MASDRAVAVGHFEVSFICKLAGRTNGSGEVTVGKLAAVDKYARPCRGVHGGQDYVGAVLSAAHYHARIRNNQCIELVDAHIPGVHLCQ